MFGIGDMAAMANRLELFANKFMPGVSRLALDCLEELHYNRTREQIDGSQTVDVTPYTKYDFVWNHL